MKNILSLQSHVAYGYAGNSAATFVLQRMGYEVVKINTVQFATHSSYGKIFGDVMPLEHIDKIFQGLKELNILNNIQSVLTGYMGDKALGEILLKWLEYIRSVNDNVLYCCDPVIGDVGRGVFVKEGVGAFFQQYAAKVSDIITPNHFELSYLTGINVQTLDDAILACNMLHAQGVKTILVTSLEVNEIADDVIQMLVSDRSKPFSNEGEMYLISTPKLPMPIPVGGAGDMTAAIFFAQFMETRDAKSSLEYTASKVFKIFERTFAANRRELALIQGQDDLIRTQIDFIAQTISL